MPSTALQWPQQLSPICVTSIRRAQADAKSAPDNARAIDRQPTPDTGVQKQVCSATAYIFLPVRLQVGQGDGHGSILAVAHIRRRLSSLKDFIRLRLRGPALSNSSSPVVRVHPGLRAKVCRLVSLQRGAAALHPDVCGLLVE